MRNLRFNLVLTLWVAALSHCAAQAITTEISNSDCVAGPHPIDVRATYNATAPASFVVRWTTTATASGGKDTTDIVLQVYREWAPRGVDRFYQLIMDNYYDCAAFFRVDPAFVVQFGIASNPNITAKWDYAIRDDPVLQPNAKGTVTFASSGRHSRSTQLFVNLQDNPGLDSSGFAPIGKIISGMAVVAAIVDPAPENLGSGVDQTAYEYGGNDWILGEYPSIDIIVNTTLQLGDFAPPTMAATQLDPQPELPLQENPQQEQSSAIHAFFWLTFALLSLPLL